MSPQWFKWPLRILGACLAAYCMHLTFVWMRPIWASGIALQLPNWFYIILNPNIRRFELALAILIWGCLVWGAHDRLSLRNAFISSLISVMAVRQSFMILNLAGRYVVSPWIHRIEEFMYFTEAWPIINGFPWGWFVDPLTFPIALTATIIALTTFWVAGRLTTWATVRRLLLTGGFGFAIGLATLHLGIQLIGMFLVPAIIFSLSYLFIQLGEQQARWTRWIAATVLTLGVVVPLSVWVGSLAYIPAAF